MPYAALCDQAVGKRTHFLESTPQHDRFQTIVMVQMDMRGCHAKIVMIMLQRCEAAGQHALVMIIDIADHGNAMMRFVGGLALLLKPPAHQIAERFGAILIAVAFDQAIELFGKGFVYRDGNPAHDFYLNE